MSDLDARESSLGAGVSYCHTFVVLSLGFTFIGKLNIRKYLPSLLPSCLPVSCEVEL